MKYSLSYISRVYYFAYSDAQWYRLYFGYLLLSIAVLKLLIDQLASVGPKLISTSEIHSFPVEYFCGRNWWNYLSLSSQFYYFILKSHGIIGTNFKGWRHDGRDRMASGMICYWGKLLLLRGVQSSANGILGARCGAMSPNYYGTNLQHSRRLQCFESCGEVRKHGCMGIAMLRSHFAH